MDVGESQKINITTCVQSKWMSVGVRKLIPQLLVLILAILTCHFRVVYSIAVVLPKKLVFATSRLS